MLIIYFNHYYYFQREKDGFLSEFLAVLRSYGNDLMTKLSSSSSSFTIFAPINDAWKDNGVQMALKNETLMRDIVNLHVVQNRYATSAIREKNSNEVTNEFDISFNHNNRSKKISNLTAQFKKINK